MWLNLGLLFFLATASPLYKDVKFLGFSVNEQTCAWQVNVIDAQKKVHYVVVRIVEVDTNKVVATFKASASTQEALEDADFAQALSKNEWQKFKAKAKFSSKLLPMNDPVVRLAVDEDTKAALKAEKNAIDIKGEVSSPIGFRPVVYLANGKLVSLGHFRIESSEGENITSKVEVYRSNSAFRLAILSKFRIDDKPAPMGAVFNLPEVIGTNTIGTMKLINAHLRIDADIFREMFPEDADMYDTYVGKEW